MKRKVGDAALMKSSIGLRVSRREDERHLQGRGRFVGDIKLPGMLEVAFVRSPVAHGVIRKITKPCHADSSVFTHADLIGVQPIITPVTTPGFQHSECPVLAFDRVRFVGEPIAACIAPDRARAEDLVEEVLLDIEELMAVTTIEGALSSDAPLLHEGWTDNRFVEMLTEVDLAAIAPEAPVVVSVEVELSRQTIHPLEGRGIVAHWDFGADQLVLAMSTQIPHPVRSGMAQFLGIPESKIRVSPPDIGGGFGYKLQLLPEEIVVAWLALKHKTPFRWVEDRREHLVAGACTRQAKYKLTGHATPEGRLVGLNADIYIDNGAYSAWPFTAVLEGYSARSNLPGPYQITHYQSRVNVVATNKPSFCPYRGIARVGTCFAIESVIDAVAHAVGREPCDVRELNLVPPESMPFHDVTGKLFDVGDYGKSLRRARELIDFDKFRSEQQSSDSAPSRILTGIGFATFYEQTANGASFFSSWGMPVVPGLDQATLKVNADGTLQVKLGLQSFGQGLETSLAQVAATATGFDLERIQVRLGDTEQTPHSVGSFTSRSAVIGAGAIEAASKVLKQRIRTVAAGLLGEVDPDSVEIDKGAAFIGDKNVTFEEIAHIFYLKPHLLPACAQNITSLEVTEGYKVPVDSGIFAYGTHAVKVQVDTGTGQINIIDYVIVEDCGERINPMIVEGQTIGGAAQGIGTALFEESPYDENGQPLASTLLDYLLPGAAEVPRFRLDHIVSPSPHTSFGVKGAGESGTIPAAAAIANAINDALLPLGAKVRTLPMTPPRILAAIAATGENYEAF
ncbi:xanthine dehydrogenase family protein molybdopterin-binding subunit [Pseudomonas sp. EGD-AK9]|uniref:xanthine dehydrogenase family protein molybdopterin-binding subunit n=1 Tax=Pseudomonas sp. EGD-AK9 TaxID=1386078 RepID=UPI0004035967|nr:xanthine dehydrogenase family protein molybdopterin-binding subunit [Pseudomonas sp. EGD-AK9]